MQFQVNLITFFPVLFDIKVLKCFKVKVWTNEIFQKCTITGRFMWTYVGPALPARIFLNPCGTSFLPLFISENGESVSAQQGLSSGELQMDSLDFQGPSVRCVCKVQLQTISEAFGLVYR